LRAEPSAREFRLYLVIATRHTGEVARQCCRRR
jgi:hypothetical protein